MQQIKVPYLRYLRLEGCYELLGKNPKGPSGHSFKKGWIHNTLDGIEYAVVYKNIETKKIKVAQRSQNLCE